MNDIIMRRTRLPRGVFGLVIRDPAGDYNVYIAEGLSPDLERRTILHEIAHIDEGHLESDWPVELCEARAREICHE